MKKDMNLKGKIYISLFLFLFGMLTLVLIISIPKVKNSINNEKNAVFAQQWQYSINDSKYEKIDLPIFLKGTKGEEIILKNYLPNDVIKGETVLIRSSQQTLKVYVDNQLIYDTASESPNSSYHFVRMPQECSGKEIKIVVTSPYAKYSGAIEEIYIGSKASNIFFVIQQKAYSFIVGIILFTFGIFFMIIFPFSKHKKYNIKFLYLSGFFLSAGIWILAESRLMQFFIPHPISVTSVSIFSLITIPIFLSLYYNDYFKKKFNKFFIGLTCFYFTMFIVGIVGTLFNDYFPIYLLQYATISIIVFLFVLLALHIIYLRTEKMKKKRLFIALIILCVLCSFDSFFYIFYIRIYSKTQLFILGILIYSIIQVWDIITEFSLDYQDHLLLQVLKKEVFTDPLTKIKNSTAFYQDIEQLNLDKVKNVSFIMYDANDLKLVNDNLGHLMGDKMLKEVALIIKNSFKEKVNIYRIGGDEFVAIITPNDTFNPNSYKTDLLYMIKKINLDSHDYKISLAVGHASFNETLDKNIYDTFDRADKDMYDDKHIYKLGKKNL